MSGIISPSLAGDLKLPTTRRVPDIESYEYVEKQDTIKKRMAQNNFKSFYGHVICEIILWVICVYTIRMNISCWI